MCLLLIPFWAVFVDIDLVDRTDGIRFLLHQLSEGPEELTCYIASAFLSLVDSPNTRAYLSVGSDLEVQISL